jgi:uncharacterized protein
MNAINWFEIPTADFERACRFYEQILDVSLRQDTSFPGIRMACLPYQHPGVGGCIIEMEQARPHQDGARIYLNGGEDLGVILNRVKAAGGEVILGKTLLRDDIGYIGLFGDSEGNVVGLHSMA